MDDCIFCKIASGDIPCHKIFENDKVLAFLDISPACLGHTLIIPKKHFVNIFEIEDDYLKEIIAAAKKIATKMKSDFNADGVNVFQSNGEAAEQTVFHFHLHLLPRRVGDGIDFSSVLIRSGEKIIDKRFEEIKDILKE